MDIPYVIVVLMIMIAAIVMKWKKLNCVPSKAIFILLLLINSSALVLYAISINLWITENSFLYLLALKIMTMMKG